MIKMLLVSGTGTDVGKTQIVCGLIRQLLKRGADCAVMKPVQTGAVRRADGTRTLPDVDCVKTLAGLAIPQEELAHVCPYCFEPPCSPHLAARMAGQRILLPKLAASARWLSERHETVIVETAGGLMAPLNESETMLDLAQALNAPVLLAAHAGLGTLNHVFLSLEALRNRRLECAGVVLNETLPLDPAQGFILGDNAKTIESFSGVRVLARVPYLGVPPDLNRLDTSLEPAGELWG